MFKNIYSVLNVFNDDSKHLLYYGHTVEYWANVSHLCHFSNPVQ